MSEFKFRIWNTKKDRWLCGGDWIGINNHGVVVNDREDTNNLSLCNNVVIQQYTGMKDRNEKDIFEGDIVFAFEENENYEVKFYKGMFCLYCRKEFVYSPLYEYLDCIVMGNVFENPELLK